MVSESTFIILFGVERKLEITHVELFPVMYSCCNANEQWSFVSGFYFFYLVRKSGIVLLNCALSCADVETRMSM